ncbi:hypothetical protein PHLCEN_2v921 [Hermanssonia centrifuga]|uniref:Uncharacterized protein n=1 Tax=Hermanssonia centrifuga TaxID=98765 RepID=A0A2R6S4P3_9APHY|nr:hypothetical protein PHLCEN_2v921 [Hermanssonia centrifuga]
MEGERKNRGEEGREWKYRGEDGLEVEPERIARGDRDLETGSGLRNKDDGKSERLEEAGRGTGEAWGDE